MFHHHPPEEEVPTPVFVKWYLLSFLAGSVNAGGFLAAGRFVTHVTGFGTLFGVEIAHQRWGSAAGIVFVPVFFLLGTVVSAYMIDHRFHRGDKPHYDWVMLLVFCCLCTAAVGGELKWFGAFGEPLRLQRDFVLLALLCMASGLQNAAITTATGARVRTTHLTGITTDLGIGLVQAWDLKRSKKRRQSEVHANWLRVGTILFFYGGSILGAILFMKLHYRGFFLPASIALYALFEARLAAQRKTLAQPSIAS